MRQKFDSYDDYRQVVDELESRLTKIIDEHKWEQLERELLKIIAWADKNNIPQDRLPRDTEELCNLDALYLNGLKLTHLPDSIGKLTNLRELNIRGNPLVVRYNLDETVYTNDIINKIKVFESKREEEERVREESFLQQMLKRIELEKAQEDAKIINRIKRFFS